LEEMQITKMTDFIRTYGIGDTVAASLSFASRGHRVDDPRNSPLHGGLTIEFDLTGTHFKGLESAYESSGNSIAVGQVPEPSTGLLLALRLAGLSVVLARKRARSCVADATIYALVVIPVKDDLLRQYGATARQDQSFAWPRAAVSAGV
jgi:hypothetical protein